MISVDEAIARVLAESRPLGSAPCALDQALGLVLAEEIASDVDSPPFDKALMDGYAIISGDLASGQATLEVIEEIAAGETPTRLVTPGTAARIMTGAPIPEGADAVVMIERSKFLEPNRVELTDKPARSGQNIMLRAEAMRCGEVVMRAGTVLRPMEIGLLAEVGQATPLVHAVPRAAILSTGNELVAVDQIPGEGQIRNSNSSMLHAQCLRMGASATMLGIARDDEELLRESIGRGLDAADILLISGGVSAGKFDLAPKVLESLGAVNCFRQVFLKPGKPLWFGYFDGEQGRKLIFGLPGNPVSSLVCFELFVAPAIARLKGHAPAPRRRRMARLAEAWTQRGDRPTFHPGAAEVGSQDGLVVVSPLAWKGSADLRTLAKANCLICFPPGEMAYAAGEPIDTIELA
jgi:molybdopterin molybdotransferase